MRALILAAGLGTRMRSLSKLCPKPALPIRGVPVIGCTLALLRQHGVREVVINLHHLGDQVRSAVERFLPDGMDVRFSEEQQLLGTGGAIRRVADFLRESDPALVLGGDMLLDADLGELVRRHRKRGDFATLLLCRDARAADFGTIGVDANGCVRRIGRRLDLGGEEDAGVFVTARVLSAQSLDSLPPRQTFEDLSDWLGPRLKGGARDIRAEILGAADCIWEPVGTPAEYLRANLCPPRLSYMSPAATAKLGGARVLGDVVLGAGAEIGSAAELSQTVVWAGERVPSGLRARGGVFADGCFHACTDVPPRDRAGQP